MENKKERKAFLKNSGMNAYNASKKIERLEKDNQILKAKLKEKDNQIKFREDKFHEQKKITNELYDENQTLKEEIQQLKQQTTQETEKSYTIFVSWDKGDIDSSFIDNIFDVMCLKKAGAEDKSVYGSTLTYLFEGTQSSKKTLIRTLTAIYQTMYSESNISVFAKERTKNN